MTAVPDLPFRDPETPWYRPLRVAVKTTTTVELRAGLDDVPVRRNDGDGFAHAAPRIAEIVMTSVHGGGRAVVHGVTVATDLGGRYFRRKVRDDTWPEDTPSWVRFLASTVEAGGLAPPIQRCEECGYAVQPDGRGGWQHTSALAADSRHAVTVTGGFR